MKLQQLLGWSSEQIRENYSVALTKAIIGKQSTKTGQEVKKVQHAGGYRIEDDYLITEEGSRLLGKPLPKKAIEMTAKRPSVDFFSIS